MTTTAFNEATVEDAALAWLEGIGYDTINGAILAPGEPAAERDETGRIRCRIPSSTSPAGPQAAESGPLAYEK